MYLEVGLTREKNNAGQAQTMTLALDPGTCSGRNAKTSAPTAVH